MASRILKAFTNHFSNFVGRKCIKFKDRKGDTREVNGLMSTPSFTELGKSIREVLHLGYQYGKRVIKVTVKTKSRQDLELGANYNLNCDNAEARGDAVVRMRLQDYGIISEKWYSDGTIHLEYGIDGRPIKGLGFITGYSYNPTAGTSDLQVTTKFKNNTVNLSCSILNSLDENFNFLAGAVVGIKKLFIGYQIGYETSTKSLIKSDIGLTYKFPGIDVHFKCAPKLSNDYSLAAIYQVNENIKTAINANLMASDGNRNWTYGFGVQYRPDERSTMRMKLDRTLQLDTSMQQLVYEGIKVTLAFDIDLKDILNGSHRIGLIFDIDV